MKNKVVTREEWLNARGALLKKEKEFTRLRQQLAKERRQLPWVKVDKKYVFQAPEGEKTLADLFGSRSQLITYHFMLGPDWKEGCQSCSYIADHMQGPSLHLPHRDVALLAVSRAPLAQIEHFKERMGWTFRWVSSFGSEFNFDYGVSFTEDQIAQNKVRYNYRDEYKWAGSDMPGVSAFYKDADGTVYHTYSSFARGLENLIGTYQYLDIAPKGRDEDHFEGSKMAWVRHHDRYPVLD